jgi:hypothetical protein
MDYAAFQLAFWHPFGPHSHETPAQIIARKRQETVNAGWTLWSFRHYRELTYNAWLQQLKAANHDGAYVFCSCSKSAVDPARDGNSSQALKCKSYRFLTGDESQWKPIPSGVCVPHSFRKGQTLASAFVVKQIIHPVTCFRPPAVEWFSVRKGPWCQERMPTKGEYLIRPGGTHSMRDVGAVLELAPPYLAVVSAEDLS